MAFSAATNRLFVASFLLRRPPTAQEAARQVSSAFAPFRRSNLFSPAHFGLIEIKLLKGTPLQPEAFNAAADKSVAERKGAAGRTGAREGKGETNPNGDAFCLSLCVSVSFLSVSLSPHLFSFVAHLELQWKEQVLVRD